MNKKKIVIIIMIMIMILILLIVGVAFFLFRENSNERKVKKIMTTEEVRKFNFDTHMVTLNSGYEMPLNGIGTYSLTGEECYNSITSALESGVRLIDTAYMYHTQADVEEQEAYDEEQFWKDYQVQLARAMPMWMPNWLNECLPGWCIQYQLYDRTTGDFLFSMVYCADALTGEVAYYQPNE